MKKKHIIRCLAALIIAGTTALVIRSGGFMSKFIRQTDIGVQSNTQVEDSVQIRNTPTLTPKEIAEQELQMVYREAREQLKAYPEKGPMRVLDFLNRIKGKFSVAAMHNREPNSEPDLQTKRMKRLTGLTPGMWSGDFLFSSDDVRNRTKMIEECVKQWENGAIVQLMLHVTAPGRDEVGAWNGDVLCQLDDEEWENLITPGGEMNRLWMERLDNYASYFQILKEKGVTVLFRPFHEMNQKAFWWGGRPGVNGTAALYRLTHDYFTNEKGLDNIVWVWNVQDLDYDWHAYNPGEDYWDVFSVDFYNPDGYTQKKYELALEVANGKPMGIGECDVLPDIEKLEEQPEWVFFMGWSELVFESNSVDKIRELYNSQRVLVLEELPSFK